MELEHEQLIKNRLTKAQRRMVEMKLKSFFSLPSRIEGLKERAYPSITAGYQLNEVQRNTIPQSGTEKILMIREQLWQTQAEYRLLQRIREQLEEDDPDLLQIWDMRFRKKHRYTDQVVIDMLRYGNRNTYYEAKEKLFGVIADHFGIWED